MNANTRSNNLGIGSAPAIPDAKGDVEPIVSSPLNGPESSSETSGVNESVGLNDLPVSSKSSESQACGTTSNSPTSARPIRVYGITGHTRFVEIPLSEEQLEIGLEFSFEKRRYRIASVVPMTSGEIAINVIPLEKSVF